MKEIKDVILYSRESSKGQADLESGKSDVDVCWKWIENNRWNVVDEFLDKDVCGNIPFEDREEGGKAAALIRTGRIDAVVSPRIDRLTRSEKMADRGYIYDLLGEHDTAFASPNEGIFNCTDLVGDVQYNIRAAVANEERQKIIKRAKDGHDAAVRDNRSPGGTHPFGIRWVHLGKDHLNRGYWEVIEEEHQALSRFFNLVRKGYALETIADMLNEEGIKTKTGKKWGSTTLNYILKNDLYFTGVLNNGVDTGIKLFTKAEIMEVRRCRKAHPSTKRKKTRANEAKYPPGYKLLQGFLYCECGRVMTPHTSGLHYRCKRKGCRSDGLRMKETNERVWDAFENKLTDPEILYDAWRADNLIPSGDLKEARKRIRIADGKLKLIEEGKDRFTIGWGKGRITPTVYEAQMEELEKKEAQWKREKARAENTTNDSDEMELAAEKAAHYMKDKISVIRAIREVKASLVDADMETQLRYKPKLVEILQRLSDTVKEDIPNTIRAEDIKDLTYQLKRNMLKEAHQNGAVRIISAKGGHIYFEGNLISQESGTARFG